MRLLYAILLLSIPTTVYCMVGACYPGFPKPRRTVAEIVELCRGNRGISGWHYEYKMENISQTQFDDLFSTKVEIWATFEFVASTAKQMIFPKLKKYQFSSATSFHYNNQLEIIGFPELKDILTANVSFSHNPKLTEIQFPILEYFLLHYGDLIFVNNSILPSIAMKNLKIIKTNNMIIRHNPQLKILEIEGMGLADDPAWPILTIMNKMIIEENESLTNISVKGKKPGKMVAMSRLEIRKNRKLERVEFEKFEEETEMRIEGNPKMEREVLEELKKAANLSWGRVQDYGECIMEEEIAELAILDDCRYIYGNLRLAAGARGTASCRLTRVEGNVYTGDVTVDRLDFLLEAEIYGKFESDLCDFDYSRFWAAKKGIWKSCTEKETTEMTTESTRRTETMAITTVTETIGTTERREETTESTVTTEETEIITMGRTEESTTTEEASTEESTQFTPMTDNLTESSSTQIVSPKKRETIPIRILIICGAVVLIVLFVGSAALFYYRKSKKKEERKMVEVSPNGSSSSKDSSSSRPSQTPASKSLVH